MLLRKKDRQNLISMASSNLTQQLKLLAYGSRVDGNAHDMSDLDLVIVTNDGSSVIMDDFINLKEALTKSNLPMLVQVIDWQRIPESFHQNILDNCEELVRL